MVPSFLLKFSCIGLLRTAHSSSGQCVPAPTMLTKRRLHCLRCVQGDRARPGQEAAGAVQPGHSHGQGAAGGAAAAAAGGAKQQPYRCCFGRQPAREHNTICSRGQEAHATCRCEWGCGCTPGFSPTIPATAVSTLSLARCTLDELQCSHEAGSCRYVRTPMQAHSVISQLSPTPVMQPHNVGAKFTRVACCIVLVPGCSC